MPGATAQLRIVAALYALLGLVYVAGALVVWTLWATKPDPAPAIPVQVIQIMAAFALSALSLRLRTLKRSWQLATAWGSSLLSALILYIAVRTAADELAFYWPIGPGGYSALAFVTAMWWGPVVIYSTCSYVIWRQLRAAANAG
jgi:hypothetical protein